jgi:hypothetical protein
MAAAAISGLETPEGLDLLAMVYSRSRQRMENDVERAIRMLQGGRLSGEDLEEALNILHGAAEREKGALASVAKLLPGDREAGLLLAKLLREIDRHHQSASNSVRSFYSNLCSQKGQKPGVPSDTPEEKEAARIILVRNPAFPGPIEDAYIEMKVKEKGLKFESRFSGLKSYELAAFIDGRRSLLDIRNAVSAECGPVGLAEVKLYFDILEAIGLVSLNKKR